jgi:L-asparaginase
LISDKPYFYYPPSTPTGKVAYDVSNVTSIPRVDILFSYEDMHNDTLYNAIEAGAKGIVVSNRKISLALTSADLSASRLPERELVV